MRNGLPYHGISPDTALEALSDPLGTDDLARISETCRRGCDDLTDRSLKGQTKKSLRLFSTWEITSYLIPVAPAHFRRVLRQNPSLPHPIWSLPYP